MQDQGSIQGYELNMHNQNTSFSVASNSLFSPARIVKIASNDHEDMDKCFLRVDNALYNTV